MIRSVSGCPRFEGPIVRIDEKPRVPASRYAVTGIYMYDAESSSSSKSCQPSDRGELEITDVNNAYISKAGCSMTPRRLVDGRRTFESLLRARTSFPADSTTGSFAISRSKSCDCW